MRRHGFTRSSAPLLLLGVLALACGPGGIAPSHNRSEGTGTNALTSAAGTLAVFAGVPSGRGSADGTGSAARFYYPSGVAVDGSGSLYVADMLNHTIRKVTQTGVVTTIAGSAGQSGSIDGTSSAARFNSPQGVAVDASGNVFVADSGNNTIRKITAAGVVTTLAGTAGQSGPYDGTGSAARFSAPSSVAVDGAGNVYVADTGNNRIRKIIPSSEVSTLAGGTQGNADGTGSAAQFDYPSGVAVDGSDNVYVADTFNDSIRKITPAGAVSTLAGTGACGNADGTGSAAQFCGPSGVAVDASGNIYVADDWNYSVRKVTMAGAVTTLAGNPGQSGSSDGTGSDARFREPAAVGVDGSGNVYVADRDNNAIRKITPAGAVSTLAGIAGQIGSADGTGSDARFDTPGGVAVDRSGNVYVADHDNHTIRKISPSGSVTTLAGTAGVQGSADGTGTAARFRYPSDVAVDEFGNVFVADSYNHIIRKITPSGAVSTFAGSAGLPGWADGTGSDARFDQPDGVAVDGSGNVYVGDTYNHTIRKITPSSVVSTLAGSAGLPGSADGTGPDARFRHPHGVAVDGSGNVYVADSDNQIIREITSYGAVSTIAGTATQPGSADGTDSAARFYWPAAVSMDASGNVYVADTMNHTIRKITPSDAVSTVVGVPASWPVGNVTGPLPASLIEPRSVAVDPTTGDLFITVDSAVLVATNDGSIVGGGGGGGSVGAAALTISPATATVGTGQTQAFTASGGSGGYTWSVSTNNSGGSITSAGIYTAGSTGGVSDTVTVTDSNNASITATVAVTAAVSASRPGGGCGCGQGSQGMVGLVALLLAGTLRRRPIRAASLTSSSSLRAAPRTSAVLDPRH